MKSRSLSRAALMGFAGSALLICTSSKASVAKDVDREKAKAPSAATLTISDVLVPGHGKTTIEFRRGDTLVRATVHNYHNVPTKERSIRGTFYPVYLVVTSKTHREPGKLQTVAKLLKALEAEGITVAEERVLKRKNPDDDLEPRVRVLKLKYGEGK